MTISVILVSCANHQQSFHRGFWLWGSCEHEVGCLVSSVFADLAVLLLVDH
jgi:hypothetical protein